MAAPRHIEGLFSGMQVHRDIPTLGGLTPDTPGSPRQRLAESGERAQGEIAALLLRARSRARLLQAVRGVSLLAAGIGLSLLAGALLASVHGTPAARIPGPFLPPAP